MDLYSWINEILIALLKHGWSLTTIGIALAALLRVNGIRRIILRRLPKRFRTEDRLERMERKIDALSAHMGVPVCGVSEITTVGVRSLKPSWRSSQAVIFINLRGKWIMQKFKSRKFILAVVSAILIVLNDGLDLGINNETVLAFAGLVAIWITGETVVDTARAKKSADEPTNIEETYH